MADTDYSIDLRTRSPFWARMASFFVAAAWLHRKKVLRQDPFQPRV